MRSGGTSGSSSAARKAGRAAKRVTRYHELAGTGRKHAFRTRPGHDAIRANLKHVSKKLLAYELCLSQTRKPEKQKPLPGVGDG
jgi:hypothetical protein